MTLNFPLLIEPEDLKAQFEQGLISPQQVRIVDLSRESIYQQVHLPNAIHISPKQLVQHNDEITGLLPSANALQQLISQLNLSSQHWVMVYDDEGGAWASRLLWTLHCVGFERVSLINGGIYACIANDLALTSEMSRLQAVDELYQIDLSQLKQVRIAYDELLALLQDTSQDRSSAVQIWDCRSIEEFIGEKRMARRAGHMPTAVHLDWLALFDKQNQFKLYPLNELQQKLTQAGLDLTQPLVVYCQSHHRSSLAYFVARLLQCSVRAYDGAWSEWGNRSDSLIVSGK